MDTLQKTCAMCHGRGKIIHQYAYGDFAPDFCTCPTGQRLETLEMERTEDAVDIAICETTCQLWLEGFHREGCAFRKAVDVTAQRISESRVDVALGN